MLELLRKAGKTWMAKGLLLLLVGAFGVWGVHASMFAAPADAVVKVGDQKVTNTEFRIVFNRVMTQMSRSIPGLTLEQAKLFGAENLVLNQLASGAAMDQLASDMNLGLSEDRLLKTIQEEPVFKDATGAFSRSQMERVLYNNQIRMEDYLKTTSQQAVRSQVIDAVAGGFEPSKTLTDAMQAYADETRSIDYLILTDANIDPVKAPSGEVLDKWFADNKAKYKAPEYRKFTYVKLEPSDIADPNAISDAQVKNDYDTHKDAYRTPETRTIEQLAFANKADADAAAAKLASGTTFDKLVTDEGKTPTDVLLGDFTKDKMPNPKMGDAAFAVAAEGGVTPVVDGLLGPVILRVTNIRPEVVKSFDDVKNDIRKQLALVQANDDIQSVFDRFEDARASGSSLAEAAKQLKLKSVTVDAIDQTGHDQKDKPVENIPESVRLLGEVFKTEPGVDALPVTMDDGGSIWFEVNDITPSRDRKLEEVKDKVLADWTREQQQLARAKKGAELARQISGGARIADLATALKIAVETKTGLKRSTEDEVLGTSAISEAFNGPVGYAGTARGGDASSQIMLTVTDVKNTPSADALDNSAAQARSTAMTAGDDLLEQVINELQAEYGVTVNRTLANQLMVR